MDPYFTQLIHHIQEVVDLGEDDASKIIETFKLKRFDKKELLLHQGGVSQHMRFLRHFSLGKKRNCFIGRRAKF